MIVLQYDILFTVCYDDPLSPTQFKLRSLHILRAQLFHAHLRKEKSDLNDGIRTENSEISKGSAINWGKKTGVMILKRREKQLWVANIWQYEIKYSQYGPPNIKRASTVLN